MQANRSGWSLAVLSIAILIAPHARAQDPPPTVNFTVNTVADLVDDNIGDGQCHTSANTCSLRAAVMQANYFATPGITNILLPAGIYGITRPASVADGEADGDLNLTAPLSTGQSIAIIGAGAATTVIDANRIGRALRIDGGRFATIAKVTIRNGLADDSGGGISTTFSTVTIADCVIEANQSSNNGGGIYNGFTALTIIRSTIRSNIAGDTGGGMFVFGRTTIRDSTFSGNGADEGGGIENGDELYLINSTLSGNYAFGDGGGIYNSDTTFAYNTSIVDNDANHQSVMFGSGGGVFAQAGSRFAVFNTLIVGNTNHGSFPRDCDGPLEAHGWNLLGSAANCTITAPFTWGLIARNTLGPLRNNGGPTPTHALLAGSPAINSTNNEGCVNESTASLTADQRGLPRGTGLDCDVGAFEYGAGVIFENGFE